MHAEADPHVGALLHALMNRKLRVAGRAGTRHGQELVRKRAAMRRSLGHMLNRGLSRGWGAWVEMARSVPRSCRSCARAWLHGEPQARARLGRRLGERVAIASRDDPMSKASCYFVNRELSRGWNAWHDTWSELDEASAARCGAAWAHAEPRAVARLGRVARDGDRARGVHAEAAQGLELHGQPQAGALHLPVALRRRLRRADGPADVEGAAHFHEPRAVAWLGRVALDVGRSSSASARRCARAWLTCCTASCRRVGRVGGDGGRSAPSSCRSCARA